MRKQDKYREAESLVKRLNTSGAVDILFPKKNKAAQELGKLGGKAGKGKSKVRGDSEYYRTIRKKRKPKLEKI